jgi:hypothetical protein
MMNKIDFVEETKLFESCDGHAYVDMTRIADAQDLYEDANTRALWLCWLRSAFAGRKV